MPCPTVIFLKAQIRGGAAADLFATPVTVAPHVRDGKVVPGYTAIRHKAPAETAPEPVPVADATPAAADPVPPITPPLAAAYRARQAARVAAKAAYVYDPYGRQAEMPEAIALREAEARVAEEEIAARAARPSTPESMRALLGIPEDWHIERTFTSGKQRPRIVAVPKERERMLLHFDGTQTLATWQGWNYGQRVDGGYWERIGPKSPVPVADAIAWQIARRAEWQRRMEESRAHYAEQQRREAEEAAERERRLAAPVDVGADDIQPGQYGRFQVHHGRFGREAEPGFFLLFPYKAKDVEKVKTIPGRRWDADRRAWFIPMTSQAVLRDFLGLDQPAPAPAPAAPARSKPYSAFLIPAGARDALLKEIPPHYPELVGHHITHTYGVPKGSPAPAAPGTARVVGIADDGKGLEALVVELDGSTRRPDGSTWHITWSKENGRLPRESNDVIATHGWRTLPAPLDLPGLIPIVDNRDSAPAELAGLPPDARLVQGDRPLTKGKWRVELESDRLGALSNWQPTPEEALAEARLRLANREHGERVRADQAAKEAGIAARLRAGGELTDADLQVLDLRPYSRFDYLSPVAQRLFGISKMKVREAMGDALSYQVNGMNTAAHWMGDPKKALANAARWARDREAAVMVKPLRKRVKA